MPPFFIPDLSTQNKNLPLYIKEAVSKQLMF